MFFHVHCSAQEAFCHQSHKKRRRNSQVRLQLQISNCVFFRETFTRCGRCGGWSCGVVARFGFNVYSFYLSRHSDSLLRVRGWFSGSYIFKTPKIVFHSCANPKWNYLIFTPIISASCGLFERIRHSRMRNTSRNKRVWVLDGRNSGNKLGKRRARRKNCALCRSGNVLTPGVSMYRRVHVLRCWCVDMCWYVDCHCDVLMTLY
jgi:hypothetical protein